MTWLQRNKAGKWRELAESKGSGTRMALRTTSLRKPGTQRFKATVVLKGGVASSQSLVVRTVPTRSTRRA